MGGSNLPQGSMYKFVQKLKSKKNEKEN